MSTTMVPVTHLPALPPGWTYNAAGQPVPMPMVAGVPTDSGFSLSSVENWFTESTLISSLPNWATVGLGLLGLMAISSLGGRRRR